MSQDKSTSAINTILEAILNSSKFLEKLPEVIEIAKSPEKVLALSQLYGNIVNTTVNAYIASMEAAKAPTIDQVGNLVTTLQNTTFLNDWQKQFFLMHFTGVHVQFLGDSGDGRIVIVSGQPGTKDPEDTSKPPKEDKEPEPRVPETGL